MPSFLYGKSRHQTFHVKNVCKICHQGVKTLLFQCVLIDPYQLFRSSLVLMLLLRFFYKKLLIFAFFLTFWTLYLCTSIRYISENFQMFKIYSKVDIWKSSDIYRILMQSYSVTNTKKHLFLVFFDLSDAISLHQYSIYI